MLLRFATQRFNPADEPANPINPISGQALLAWLGAELGQMGYRASEPRPEDWGWYSYIDDPAARPHLVGASGEGAGNVEWCLQIHRRRSLWDRVRGANRLEPGSPLVAAVEALLRAQADFRRVEREVEP